MDRAGAALVASAIALGGGCADRTPAAAPGARPILRFTDVTAAAGIDWSHPDGEIGASGMLRDLDGDGCPDVLVGGERDGPRLYRNRCDGTFVDVTAAAGLLPVTGLMSFAVADVDGDGDQDLYIAADGGGQLWLNAGDGTFARAAGSGTEGSGFVAAAAFADYDRDGDQDLYVGTYVAGGDFPNLVGGPNALYQNQGDGTFRDVAADLGVAGAGTTLAALWQDLDGDGWVDLIVCNDFGAEVEGNRVYRNRGGAGFEDVSARWGLDQRIYCMGVDSADIDGDGDADVYLTNLGRNVLLENRLPDGFIDVTEARGVAMGRDPADDSVLLSSWGVAFDDFDGDGRAELFVSTGFVPTDPGLANTADARSALFRLAPGTDVYVDEAAAAGVGAPSYGRGVSCADFDGDGDIDILQVSIKGPPRLFRNDRVR